MFGMSNEWYLELAFCNLDLYYGEKFIKVHEDNIYQIEGHYQLYMKDLKNCKTWLELLTVEDEYNHKDIFEFTEYTDDENLNNSLNKFKQWKFYD